MSGRLREMLGRLRERSRVISPTGYDYQNTRILWLPGISFVCGREPEEGGNWQDEPSFVCRSGCGWSFFF